MPLTGELEHLPIIDVVQLIHSTRKSGTLNVYSRKGEGQLVFKDGRIIRASHSHEKLKIGNVLVDNKIITDEQLQKALDIQKHAGKERKPLIATLYDHCDLTGDEAYKGLEMLIILIIVEMISWSRGVFSLDVDELSEAADNYLPKSVLDFYLDTQMVLMDALRIFDEKVHAGEIEILDEPLEDFPLDNLPLEISEGEEIEDDTEEDQNDTRISEEILGLDDLDNVKRKKPHVFKVLEAFDPAQIHRQVIDGALVEVPPEDKEQLGAYLEHISSSAGDHAMPATKSQAVILYTWDEFFQHAIMTVSKKEGVLVFSTSQRQDLESLIDRALYKYLEPILVFGTPAENVDGFNQQELTQTRSELQNKYPHLEVLQFASPKDFSFSLRALHDGVRAVFPSPSLIDVPDAFADNMIEVLNSYQAYLHGCCNEERKRQFAILRNGLAGLKALKTAPEISLQLLQIVGEYFDRALTLIVDRTDLIAERNIGISGDRKMGIGAAMKFRIPIRKDSSLWDVINSGDAYFGTTEDSAIKELIYAEIGAPTDSTYMLLPLRCNERTITITYADFGRHPARRVALDFIEFFTGQAGTCMENALFRKKLSQAK
ncbi:MAG: hypothetical protein C0622_07160 [Desulfuromonas sp.]|nr:MAG: hypothetical protein C0622_07160 [Desulfuromonas sp.]